MAFASLAALSAALSFLSFAAPSAAGDAAGQSDAAASAQPGQDTKAQAKAAFDEGLAAVASGEYDTAIAAFRRAQELRPHPTTLFNLALALERAERLPEAWALYDAALDTLDSDDGRREVRVHMQTIETRIAVLEVAAEPTQRLCINGHDMPRVGELYRVALAPGDHQILLDARSVEAKLHAGERRVLVLDARVSPPPGPTRAKGAQAMVGLAAGTGALALGLGTGSLLVEERPPQLGLGAGAAASAGVAMTAGIVALLLERRRLHSTGPSSTGSPRRSNKAEPLRCPGSPAFDDRVDLDLLPDIVRPATFAALPPMPMPMPTTMPVPIPVPRPPRGALAPAI